MIISYSLALIVHPNEKASFDILPNASTEEAPHASVSRDDSPLRLTQEVTLRNFSVKPDR